MKTTISLDQLTVFMAVAEAASFTRAAARLGLDKGRVSRVIQRLESALGVALLARSTRVVKLTAEGAELAARVAPHLAGIEAAMLAADGRTRLPEGEVSITTTADIGRCLLGPLLPGFRARFPGVRVRVETGPRPVDLLAEGIDLALRVGRPAGASSVARRLLDLEAGFHASPTYLARRGVPESLDDLAAHEGLWPAPPRGKRPFAPASRASSPQASAIESEDFMLLAAVARAHGGVALLPTFLVRDDVAQGTLVRVLPRVSLGQAPLYLLSHPGSSAPSRVTALRRFLIAALSVAPSRPDRIGVRD